MMQRVRQFFIALSAQLGEKDHAYIERHLSLPAQDLFYAMNLADQYHALHVAYTAEQLAENLADERGGKELRHELLIRCALLHDVGRVKGDMGILGKVFAVLMYHFFPGLSKRWAREQARAWYDVPQHALYVYRHHPDIGAEKLLAAGFGEEADIIRLHHKKVPETAPLELRLLQQADERN